MIVARNILILEMVIINKEPKFTTTQTYMSMHTNIILLVGKVKLAQLNNYFGHTQTLIPILVLSDAKMLRSLFHYTDHLEDSLKELDSNILEN